MNDATWFRLLVRALGILLIGLGAPILLYRLGDITVYLAEGSYTTPWAYLVGSGPPLAAYVAQTAFGVYLLRGGVWLVDWCIRRTVGVSSAPQTADSRGT